MTCIVGFVDKKTNTTWIGGDSMGSNGYTHSIQDGHKVFHNDTLKNVVMGATGSFRHIDLLEFSTNLFPEIDFYKKPQIDRKYMVNTFIPNVKDLFQSQVVTECDTNRGGLFLVGVDGKLFEIQSDYSVLEPKDGYASVGCGEVAAMGSLYSTTKNCKKFTPKEHILSALEAAEKCCMGVHRPFVIVNTKTNDIEVIE
ncbi:MAG: hypothetical protein KBT27_01445 [Prevotellaceae bacterium]|nr:hypothetical protein [Candidatus Faecinaster equi]